MVRCPPPLPQTLGSNPVGREGERERGVMLAVTLVALLPDVDVVFRTGRPSLSTVWLGEISLIYGLSAVVAARAMD